MGPDVEHYHSYNCQCAVCRSRLPKPATEEDLKFYEQQAERIKELEAELDSWKQEFRAAYRRETEAEQNLTALRQRIDDAPVVAWMGEYNINDIRDHYTVVMRHKTDFSSMPDRVRPLYTTPQPAIPAGYALVPISMVEDTCPCCCQWSEDHSEAMLAAAPKQEEMK